LIRRHLNIGLHRAYRLHQQFVGTRRAPSTGGNPE
jgi:hypothetical protein